MFKGPKAILSSAIANALGTYFEVDANAIESNLVRDAKIVLNDVRLKKQVSRLPLNSAGNATIFTVTGGVETVEFKWDWSVGFGAQQLVKNAVLSIKEANFECELEHDVLQDVENSSHSIDASSFVNIETIDAVTEQVIKEEAGGIMGYVMRQVNMVIDTLTLKIDGLDFRIILPPAVALGNDAVGRQRGSPKTIFICADELKLISFGRKDKDGRQLTLDSDESKSIVQQRLTIRSFLLSIVRDGVDGGSTAEYPIIDPFSYTADVTKAGKRFGGMMHGLEVSGCVELTTSSRRLNLQQDSDSLVLYIGEQQIDALMQLSVMVLAPPSDVNLSERAQLEEKFDASVVAHSSIGESTSFASSPSSFHFPLSSASLILFDYTHAIHVSGIDLQYKADGTVCKATASKIDYESEIGGRASCLDIILTARPVRKLKFGLIQSLHIPNKLELTNPISPEISFEGNVLIIRIEEAVDVVVYGSSSSSPEVTPTDNATPLPQAPCAVDAFFKEITIKKDLDGSSMKVKSIEFYANPVKDCNCTQIAIKCLDFKNHLAQLTKLEMSCSLPMNEVNTVNEFNLSVQKAEVKGGKSSEEWSEGFRPRPTSDTTKSDKHTPPTVIRLPFAKIATLKLLITWSGTGISMKDTSISIKPFLGTAKTTTNDLITYYTSACLAKFPQFISNAEVLGINLVDQTVNTVGTWSFLPFLGAGGGVAVITGVDAIKGAVSSGKRSRKAEVDDSYRPGDLLRGVFYAATEATRDGAILRGKVDGKGNLIDWAYGATQGTTTYVSENKTKLGAAGAGGGGFLVGMALGGPIGAVIGAVVGNLAGGKTIETIDEHVKGSKLALEHGTREKSDVVKKEMAHTH